MVVGKEVAPPAVALMVGMGKAQVVETGVLVMYLARVFKVPVVVAVAMVGLVRVGLVGLVLVVGPVVAPMALLT